MASFCISLLGRFRCTYDNQELAGLEGRKVQELLCYLLLCRQRIQCRESLASVLWSDKSTVQSKKYLRQALWQLQSAVEPVQRMLHVDLFCIDQEWISLNPAVNLWLDVAVIEEAFAGVQSIPGAALTPVQLRRVQEAVALYRGELLEGWYQEWCIYERERMQSTYLMLLDKLVDYCETQQTYEAGIEYGLRILRFDRARERTHRRLMHIYYGMGDRTGALRQYQSCVTALQEELQVEPAAQTVALYKRMCADQLGGSSTRAKTPVVFPPDLLPSELSHTDLLTTLKSIQHALTALQSEVAYCIRACEQDQVQQ